MAFCYQVANGNPAQNTRKNNGWPTATPPFFVKGERSATQSKFLGHHCLEPKWQHGDKCVPTARPPVPRYWSDRCQFHNECSARNCSDLLDLDKVTLVFSKPLDCTVGTRRTSCLVGAEQPALFVCESCLELLHFERVRFQQRRQKSLQVAVTCLVAASALGRSFVPHLVDGAISESSRVLAAPITSWEGVPPEMQCSLPVKWALCARHESAPKLLRSKHGATSLQGFALRNWALSDDRLLLLQREQPSKLVFPTTHQLSARGLFSSSCILSATPNGHSSRFLAFLARFRDASRKKSLRGWGPRYLHQITL